MYRYKKILVHLNFNDDNEALIRYAGMVTKMARTEKIYFLHIASSYDIPDAIRKTYPELEPLDEFAQKKMRELIEQNFGGNPDTEVVFETGEGQILDELLNYIRRKDIDLVINNAKNPETHTLEIAEKLARKAPCSVLIVPQESESKITKVLVATDFSDHSKDAIDVGTAYAAAANLSQIHCLHAYQIPSGYHKTGKSHEEFAEIMLKNAESQYNRFIEESDLKGVSPKSLFVLSKDPAEAIRSTVASEGIDLLVLGSRGRSTGATVLLGSVTEKLLWSTNVPLLAVKKKGTGLNVLDAIFG